MLPSEASEFCRVLLVCDFGPFRKEEKNVVQRHTTEESSRYAFDTQRQHGFDDGRWMGIVFRVDEFGDLHLERTTWRFPKDRLLEALSLLKGNLEEELDMRPPAPEPLPRADIQRESPSIESRKYEAPEPIIVRQDNVKDEDHDEVPPEERMEEQSSG